MSETLSPQDELRAKMVELNVDDAVVTKLIEDLGVANVADLANLTETDLTGAGMKLIPARTLVKAMAPAPEASNVMAMSALDEVLPVLPTDESWLKALQTGGVLKVDQSTIIAAMRAAFAHRVGLFELPKRLVDAMEKFADNNDEQVDPSFFQLREELTRRTYADIFSAVPGLNGNYVTGDRKKELLARIDKHLWPSIIGFQDQLRGWQEAWMGGSNQMAMMGMMATVMTGGAGAAMAPGFMQPPDTGALRDHADAVADASNRVFAGTGVQITAALAYEASKISETLQNPRLPAMIGVANRDQMLRQLGSGIPATYARLENNLIRFVLAVLQLKNTPAGSDEIRMLSALFMLGSQISWSTLGVSDSELSGIGRGQL